MAELNIYTLYFVVDINYEIQPEIYLYTKYLQECIKSKNGDDFGYNTKMKNTEKLLHFEINNLFLANQLFNSIDAGIKVIVNNQNVITNSYFKCVTASKTVAKIKKPEVYIIRFIYENNKKTSLPFIYENNKNTSLPEHFTPYLKYLIMATYHYETEHLNILLMIEKNDCLLEEIKNLDIRNCIAVDRIPG